MTAAFEALWSASVSRCFKASRLHTLVKLKMNTDRCRRSAGSTSVIFCGILCLIAVVALAGCSKEDPIKARFSKTPVRTKLSAEETEARPKSSAPVEPAKPEFDAVAALFPHHPGDQWDMRETAGLTTNQVSLAVKSAGDKTFSIETRRNGEVVMNETYRADEKGVFRETAGNLEAGRIVPPMPMLHLPFHSGDAWQWKGEIKYSDLSIPGESSFTLAGPEPVKVPAGEFQAYRLEQKITLKVAGKTSTVTNTQWLAPQVGIVKLTTDSPDQSSMAELASYKVSPK